MNSIRHSCERGDLTLRESNSDYCDNSESQDLLKESTTVIYQVLHCATSNTLE